MIKPTGWCAMPLGNFMPHRLKVSWNDHKSVPECVFARFFLARVKPGVVLCVKEAFFCKKPMIARKQNR